jgi:phosphoribosylpyrophosphate synthetase
MLSILVNNIIYPVNVTKFPDGTSQTWKLEDSLVSVITESHVLRNLLTFEIVWNFQDDSEVVHLHSLVTLLVSMTKGRYKEINLTVPFLPGARQDKSINNHSTFNRMIYCRMINLLNFNKVKVFDCHSRLHGMLNNVEYIEPTLFHKHCLKAFSPQYVVFPDEGAFSRYQESFKGFPVVVMKKTRNQITGIIERMEVDHEKSNTYSFFDDKDRFLIVDDICDGGGTFIMAAAAIHKISNESEIALAVSHGLFSKGLGVLENAKISKIFTTNSLIQKNSMEIFNIV